MDLIAILDLDVLQPAKSSVLLALEHFNSNNFSQQLLSVDDALEALKKSKQALTLELQATNDQSCAAKSEAYKQSLTDLNKLLLRFEELQKDARHAFNLRARPLHQNKGILDLATELQLKVFDHIKGNFEKTECPCRDNWSEINDVKNLRLTCRLFCDNVSHLLIPCLHISLHTSSLQHMEEVIRHPTISPGVQLFRIHMEVRAVCLAEDFQVFSSGFRSYIQLRINNLEEELRTEDIEVYKERRMKDSLMKHRRVLSSCAPFADGTPFEEGSYLDEATLSLRRGYEHYQELIQQEEEMLHSGYFARAVAAAAERSMKKVWLLMTDDRFLTLRGFRLAGLSLSEEIGDPDALVTDYHLPKYWSSWHRGDLRKPAHSLLCELPLAMRAAGASLVGIKVNMWIPWRFNLPMSQHQVSGLGEVAQSLEHFEFRFAENERLDFKPDNDEAVSLFTYLSASMGAQNVPKLVLKLRSNNPSSNQVTVGPLLVSKTWQRLEFIHLERISMHLHELEKLVGLLQMGTKIGLRYTYLASGTWAEALDRLRTKAGLCSMLRGASGAECEEMTDEECCDIFGDVYEDWRCVDAEKSKVEQYITRVEGVKNPLRRDVEATEATAEP
ncbi:hypothetical protein J7T55_014795 [Diaporthe amygdali]|uniref:uncharacterized protein n=1 Tax=Phomopsis amygdali TaxID=1214568 RepID=UPI0022FEDAD6|nr:uncharacterized protein J7T55_014795 [Diaporthe amygdali]KAJ0109993.1 hypothetical protein J7T55_014795 [Diaporthe amygdali]